MRTAFGRTCALLALTAAAATLAAGNSAAQTVGSGGAGPTISILNPTSSTSQSPVNIDIAYAEVGEPTGVGLDLSTLQVAMDGSDITGTLLATSSSAEGSVSLGLGQHTLWASVADTLGVPASVGALFTITPPLQPNVTQTQQVVADYVFCMVNADDIGETTTCQVPATATYRVIAGGYGSGLSTHASVQVDDQDVIDLAPPAQAATVTLTLTTGSHQLSVSGLDPGTTLTVLIANEAQACWFQEPLDVYAGGSTVTVTSATMSGLPNPLGMAVAFMINGVPTGVLVTSGSIVYGGNENLSNLGTNVSMVFLSPGSGTDPLDIVATAYEPQGSPPGSFVLEVVDVDQTPPNVAMNPIGDGSGATDQPSVTVSGTVDDPYAGIAVNGTPVENVNQTWTATVALAAGSNQITVVATDPCGNTTTQAVTETYVPPAQSPVSSATTNGYVLCEQVLSEDEPTFECSAPADGSYRLIAGNASSQPDGSPLAEDGLISVNGAQVFGQTDFDNPEQAAMATVPLNGGDNAVAVSGLASGAQIFVAVLNQEHACWLQPPFWVTVSNSPVTEEFPDLNADTQPALLVVNLDPYDEWATNASLEFNGTEQLEQPLPTRVVDTQAQFATQNSITASVSAGTYKAMAIDVDETPPALAVNPVGNGTWWTDATTLVLTGTVADPTVTVAVSVGGTSQTATMTGTGMDWTATVTVAAGANTVTVTATDLCDNVATEVLSIDESPLAPVVSIVEPAGQEQPAGAISVQVQYEDDLSGVNLSTFQLILDNYDVTEQFTEGGGTVGASEADGMPMLAAGQHTLVATVSNNAGVAGSDTRIFTLTATGTPPTGTPVTVAILSPTAGTVEPPLSVDITYSEPGNPPLYLSVTLDGTSVATNGTDGPTGLMVGPNEATGGLPTCFAAGTATHTLVATVTDAEQNTATASVTFTIALEPPWIVVPGARPDPDLGIPPMLVTKDQDVRVEVFASDTGAGRVGPPTLTSSALSQGIVLSPDGDPYAGVWMGTVPLSPGSQTLTATVTNSTGDARSASVAILLDTGSPQVTWVSPPPGGAATNGDTWPVRFTYSETSSGMNVNSVALVANNSSVCALDLSDPGVATCTLTGLSSLPEGSYTLTAIVPNWVGTVTYAPTTLVVERTAPELTVTLPESSAIVTWQGQAYTALNSTTVTATPRDAAPVTLHFQLPEPAEPIDLYDVASGTPVPEYVALQEGTNSIAVTATNQLGLSTSQTVSVFLATQPPMLTFISPSAGTTVTSNSVVVTLTAVGDQGVLIAWVTVNGAQATADSNPNEWQASVIVVLPPLANGSRTLDLTAAAADIVGNTTTATPASTASSINPWEPLTVAPPPLTSAVCTSNVPSSMF